MPKMQKKTQQKIQIQIKVNKNKSHEQEKIIISQNKWVRHVLKILPVPKH